MPDPEFRESVQTRNGFLATITAVWPANVLVVQTFLERRVDSRTRHGYRVLEAWTAELELPATSRRVLDLTTVDTVDNHSLGQHNVDANAVRRAIVAADHWFTEVAVWAAANPLPDLTEPSIPADPAPGV